MSIEWNLNFTKHFEPVLLNMHTCSSLTIIITKNYSKTVYWTNILWEGSIILCNFYIHKRDPHLTNYEDSGCINTEKVIKINTVCYKIQCSDWSFSRLQSTQPSTSAVWAVRRRDARYLAAYFTALCHYKYLNGLVINIYWPKPPKK
jgi:hypothetical protein